MKISHLTRFTSLLVFVAALALLSGCGVLLGNTRPVIERSDSYAVDDLSKTNQKWVRLESAAVERAKESSAEEGQSSDVAYRSTETDSVIALNSACRPSFVHKPRDLKIFTQQLLMGISQVSEREERPVQVAETPGLETTIHGLLNGGDIKMKVIVVQKGSCLYDLMYLSEPKKFPIHEKEFSHFVSSLRLK